MMVSRRWSETCGRDRCRGNLHARRSEVGKDRGNGPRDETESRVDRTTADAHHGQPQRTGSGVLARFFAALLGWEITDEEPDRVMVRPPNGGVALSFERDVSYATPVWPSTASQQRMMMHLEVRVENLASSSAHAQACGATLATYSRRTT